MILTALTFVGILLSHRRQTPADAAAGSISHTNPGTNTDLHGATPNSASICNDPSPVSAADKHNHHDHSTVHAASRGWGGNGSSKQRQ
jgi:hypothetical protein